MWPNSQHMMIKKNLLIKMIDATNWVRCASGKVHFQRWEKLPTCWCLDSNGGSISSIRFLLEIRPIFFRFSSRLRPPKSKWPFHSSLNKCTKPSWQAFWPLPPPPLPSPSPCLVLQLGGLRLFDVFKMYNNQLQTQMCDQFLGRS